MKLNPAGVLREKVRILERYLGFLGKSEMSCCGVTFAQCHAVVEIGRAERLSLSGLAEILNLDLSTVSRTVDGLVKSKLAVRETDPENRRFVQIGLTEEGNKIYLGIEEKMNKYFTEIFAAIPEDKREQVLDSLELLLTALQKSDCCGGGSCKI